MKRTEPCPECNTIMYKNGPLYRCHVHSYFSNNLVPVDKDGKPRWILYKPKIINFEEEDNDGKQNDADDKYGDEGKLKGRL